MILVPACLAANAVFGRILIAFASVLGAAGGTTIMRIAKLWMPARYVANAVLMRHFTADACAVVAGSDTPMMQSA